MTLDEVCIALDVILRRLATFDETRVDALYYAGLDLQPLVEQPGLPEYLTVQMRGTWASLTRLGSIGETLRQASADDLARHSIDIVSCHIIARRELRARAHQAACARAN